MAGTSAFYSNFLFLIWQPFLNLNFLKPILFSFGYDCYASADMVAFQLNRQIVLRKRPLTHFWSSPLKPQDSFGRFANIFLDLQKVDHTIRKHH